MKTKQAADYFGSKKKLAAALNISPSAITMWGEEVPELRQYQIEQLTKGKVKRQPAASPQVEPAQQLAS